MDDREMSREESEYTFTTERIDPPLRCTCQLYL